MMQETSPFEALQRQTSAQSHRARPPAINVAEDRVPLRSDRVGKRESRLGLRSLFGRSKPSKEYERHSSRREHIQQPGMHSMVDRNQRPQLQSTQSEMNLRAATRPSAQPLALSSLPPPVYGSRHPAATNSNSGRFRTQPPLSRPPLNRAHSQGNLATWDPPPLFKAYPQAVKDAQLPAPGMSADAIIRNNMRKGNTVINPDPTGQDAEQTSDKVRKRHRRNTSGSYGNKYDWTTKIYVLCTSGYLLQYSGEGSFDRLPEKMLQLNKDSAAFVSDAIPGRHWVLQVSSLMEANGMAVTEPRSARSRLPFAGFEKKQASNLLLVFEGVEEMEAWITILRREIEALGGKQTVSETGQPKEEVAVPLKAQPSQRTLVIRDPDRFSRVIPQDFSWQGDGRRDSMGHSIAPMAEPGSPDTSLDDVSMTNSMISNDGRQLENLRDSAHRLSYISTGQRTMSSSSPACSPTREAFDCLPEEFSMQEPSQQLRPRPNAAAILDRRQSMQTMNMMDLGSGGHAPRARPPIAEASKAHPTPNFSVPISKRYSLVKSTSVEPLHSPPAIDNMSRDAFAPRSLRRAPPTTFTLARPLSIVADQPSPTIGAFEAKRTSRASPPSTHNSHLPSSPLTAEAPWEDAFPLPPPMSSPPRRASILPGHQPFGVNPQTSPRKASSAQSLRHAKNSSSAGTCPPEPQHLNSADLPSPPLTPHQPNEPRRCRSSMDGFSPNQAQPGQTREWKTSSIYLEADESSPPPGARPVRYSITRPSDLHIQSDIVGLATSPPDVGLQSFPLACTAPMPSRKRFSAKLEPPPHMQSLFSRRSMPQLAEGPPPAPPPTCALPPIPQRQQAA